LTDADWQQGGFGLYVHWPFCAAKCPYCDFNSHVTAHVDHARWAAALVSELRRNAKRTSGRVLNTVFFGGGTPSLMDPATVDAILSEARTLWPTANDMEITLEANPTSVESGKFRAFRDAGVNRVSMGVQALNDADLRRLGRLHSAKEAMAAFDVARGIFDRVSFDLIYAREGQTVAEWQAELHRALTMAVDHLSLYQLTIEPGTAFGDRHARGGLRDLPDDDLSADMYDATQEICDRHGMPAYEVSNHAAQGAESRHNLIYWRYGDYVGIGPGAHGRITGQDGRMATETHPAPGLWLARAESGNGESLSEPLPRSDQAAEYLMMSLRLTEGTDLGRLARLGFTPDERTCAQLTELGLVTVTDDRLTATPAGRRVLNAVLRALLADR
jgi:oxygen-independent coproporphyrinogen-3 oxidase